MHSQEKLVNRLEKRTRELRQQLVELGREDGARPQVRRDRARLGAKLRAVEKLQFELKQPRLFR